jgi:hypothetical protein
MFFLQELMLYIIYLYKKMQCFSSYLFQPQEIEVRVIILLLLLLLLLL